MRSKLNRMMSSPQPPPRVQPPPAPPKDFTILDKTKPLERAPSEAREWIVTMVAPRRELDAVTALRQAGYYAWHPQMILWLSSARHRIKAKVNRPLFPRYVMVAQRPGVTKSITDCDHVTYLVGQVPPAPRGAKPLLEDLSDRQEAGEFDGTKAPPPFFDGDVVTISDYGDLNGIVMKVEEDRIHVLMQMLNAPRKVEVSSASLAKVLDEALRKSVRRTLIGEFAG